MSWCRNRWDPDIPAESSKWQIIRRSPKLLTAEEVADLLRVNRSSVYRWVERGLLPAIKVGRTVRFNPDVVKAVLERGLAQKET
jgi:excisionase family DNA binding protein